MAKIAIIGDLHFGIKKADSSFLEYQKGYFENEFFPLIYKNGIKTVIQTGDILDSRTHIDFLVARFMHKHFFEPLKNSYINFYSVLGNHDIFYRQSTSLSGIKELTERYPNVHIITKYTSREVDNCQIDFVPWICNENVEEITQEIASSSYDRYRLCIGHFELADFEMQKGMKCSKGTFDADSLKCYNKVISGHFHTPSQKGFIEYIGTPYQLTWSDVGDAKKVILFDTETLEFEEYFTKARKYFIFNFEALKEKSFDYESCRHGYIKIILGNSKTSNAVIDKALTKLEQKSEPKQVQVLDQRDSASTEKVEEIDLQAINTPYTAIQNTIKNSTVRERVKDLSSQYVYKFYKEIESC